MIDLPEPQENQSVIEWARLVADALRRWTVSVAPGSGLLIRRGANGAAIGLQLPPLFWSGYTSGSIAAQSGNTPGTGNVKLVTLLGKPGGTWYDTKRAAVVINGTGGAVPASVYCGGHYFEGIPVITWANCSGTQAAPAALPTPSAQPMSAASGQPLQDSDGQPITSS